MRIPMVTAAVTDMIIAAMRSSGFIADDVSADTIRQVDPNISEVDRDTLAASLNYGGVGGGSGTSSTENVNVFIDSDDSDPTPPYVNYFRVSHGQNTVPVTTEHEMFSVRYSSNFPTLNWVAISPTPEDLSGGEDFGGLLQIGAGGATPTSYLQLIALIESQAALYSAGTFTIKTSESPNVPDGDLEMQLGNGTFAVTNKNGLIDRAGVYDVQNSTRFYVGERPSVGRDQFNIEKTSGVIRLRHGDQSAERVVFINGSYPNIVDDARIKVAIGGSNGTQHLDPRDLLIGGGYDDTSWYPPEPHEASFMVVSPDVNDRRAALHTFHRRAIPPQDTHLVNFHSNMNVNQSHSQTVKLLSCTAYNEANREIAFEVRGDRTTYCGGSFTNTGQDAAEYFTAVGDIETYLPGTVMKVNSSGNLIAADSYEDPAVVGVVSTSPGYVMGDVPPGAELGNRILVGVTGTVPVNATTAHGSIESGDLLTSAVGGKAAKTESATPGTIIGKAMQGLIQSGEEVVEGTIKMLIFNS